MTVKAIIQKNTYHDSVALMQISRRISEIPGVNQASVMMGTGQNIDILKEAGLFTEEVSYAKPSDLLIVVNTADELTADNVTKLVDTLLKGENREQAKSSDNQVKLTSLQCAVHEVPEVNLVSISTPGDFAAAEAMKALKKDKHVFLFSNNVSVEDEIKLKQYAHQRGLLVMGPDCGTSYIGGVPLGFVNRVRQGSIGIAGASGTGIQEIMGMVHRLGGGISQVIGTGSRDLSESVGAVTMLDALKGLAQNDDTKVIVLVSKPPSAKVADLVMDSLKRMDKPVVVCFLGYSGKIDESNIFMTETLEDAAVKAVAIAGGSEEQQVKKQVLEGPHMESSGGYIRGLFSGGTLAYEALILMHKRLPKILSNIAKNKDEMMSGKDKSTGHTVIDMGTDEFTVGKPHPMIDFSSRLKRLREEADYTDVGVILLDAVLGYGSHQDPAGELAPVIEEIIAGRKEKGGMPLKVVVNVVGTDMDPQNYDMQVKRLKDSGAVVASSNVQAINLAINAVVSDKSNEEVIG